MSDISDIISTILSHGQIKKVTLGDCIESHFGGGTPSRSVKSYWEGGSIPWASVADIVSNPFCISDTSGHITERGLSESNSSIVSPGMVIAVTRIRPGLLTIPTRDIAINQDMRGLILKPCIVPKYLVYYSMMWNIVANGSIVKGITIQQLESLPIDLPPVDIQKEIVGILDVFMEYDTILKQELKLRKTQSEYYLNFMFQKLFDGLSDSKSGFYCVPLSEVSEITMGTSPKSDQINFDGNGIEFHQGNSRFGDTVLEVSDKYTTSPVKIAKKGSILMSVRAPVGDINMTDRDIAIGRGLCSIIPFSNVDVEYLYYHLLFSMKETKKGTFGSMFESIDSKGVSDIRICVPSLDVQTTVANALKSMFEIIHVIEIELGLRKFQFEHYSRFLLSGVVAK